MHNSKRIFFLSSIAFTILFNSCSEEKVIEIQKGSIMGYIDLIDDTGSEIKDKSNIKVSLDADHTALTNSSGRFDFEDIKPGNYKVLIEKEGYGTVKKFNYPFAGGKTPGVITDVTLVGLTDITLTSKEVISTSTSLRVKGTMNSVDSYYFFYLFVEKPDADMTDYISYSGYSFCCGSTNSFDHYVPRPSNLPTPCYLILGAASSGNPDGMYDYYDYEKGKSINPAIKKLFDPVKIR